METKEQNLTDSLHNVTTETVSSNDFILDHDWFNMLMQVNLSRDNYDLEYETGYFSDSSN